MMDFSIEEGKEIIAACRARDRKAQRMLYNEFSPIFLGICRRYFKSPDEAEDSMIRGFYKILSEIEKYRGEGSFQGWMRRIIVNECLMILRKKKKVFSDLEIVDDISGQSPQIYSELNKNDLLNLLDNLPVGYRTVFNLFVIEGYSHKEISDKMNISISTSKTQLRKAKIKLQEMIGESRVA